MSRRRWLPALAAAALVSSLALPYALSHREARALDEPTRRALGGDYVRLSDGVTHFELTGPPGGPVVALVHGGTIPHWNWDVQVPALRDAGYRVLRYDHYGRGYSDRPAIDYDRALYRRQLRELLDALHIERAHLVGISFGGATSASFAAAWPDRVGRIALIAPVVHYAEGKALFGLAGIPGLGEWYARVFSVPGTLARATTFFEESGADPGYVARFEEQTLLEGYERALLSMSRTDALTDYRDTYAALAGREILLVWGSADHDIPRAHIDYLRETLQGHEYVELEGAGHGINIQRSDEVNRLLIDFLSPAGAP